MFEDLTSQVEEDIHSFQPDLRWETAVYYSKLHESAIRRNRIARRDMPIKTLKAVRHREYKNRIAILTPEEKASQLAQARSWKAANQDRIKAKRALDRSDPEKLARKRACNAASARKTRAKKRGL